MRWKISWQKCDSSLRSEPHFCEGGAITFLKRSGFWLVYVLKKDCGILGIEYQYFDHQFLFTFKQNTEIDSVDKLYHSV